MFKENYEEKINVAWKKIRLRPTNNMNCRIALTLRFLKLFDNYIDSVHPKLSDLSMNYEICRVVLRQKFYILYNLTLKLIEYMTNPVEILKITIIH